MTDVTAPARPRAPRRLLLWGVTTWALLATFLVGAALLDSISKDESGANRDPFDFYFENALSGSRDFKHTVAGFRPDMNIVAACFWSTEGIERFLDDKARGALEQDRYFRSYRSADYVWRLLLISDDQRFRTVIMAQYEEPGEDSSQYGCHALADIRPIVTPPGIRSGRPELGKIRLEKASTP